MAAELILCRCSSLEDLYQAAADALAILYPSAVCRYDVIMLVPAEGERVDYDYVCFHRITTTILCNRPPRCDTYSEMVATRNYVKSSA